MISVCMATHNGEKYIKEQIDSILYQLSDNDELIISDDGSTDNTISIIQGYNDNRIKLYHYKQICQSKTKHLYVSRNFENALLHANGDYIFLSDQDDIWFENKVAYCVQYLQKSLLVIHEFDIDDVHSLKYNGVFKQGNFLIYGQGKYYGCAMAFRKQLLNDILPFPNKLIVHDSWIGLVAEVIGSVKFIKRSLMKYRIHPISVSHSANNNIFFAINYRIYIWYNLFKRFGTKFLTAIWNMVL